MTPRTHEVVAQVAALVRPSERLTVPEAAEKYVRLSGGSYSNSATHYMVEPAECLTKREFNGVVFAGPARTGKTQALCDNWAAHGIKCDPTNHMLVFPIDDLANYYSETRIDPLHRHSPDIRKELGTGRSDDNIGKKKYRSGMLLTFVSPTKNTLAMKDLAKVGLSDYDRYEDDIGGDGPAWNLGRKRTETFMSRGMTMAESSPSKPITDSQWRLSQEHPHEAPPTNGILGLFNDGDRRRLYGQCQHCFEYFMPAPAETALFIPSEEDMPGLKDRVAHSGIVCTKCGSINGMDAEPAFKKSGIWLKEGQTITADRVIHGEGRVAKIASFWMPGWFAAFQSWSSIIETYLRALDRYERSLDELAIKACVNVDMGAPYLEKSRQSDRTSKSLQETAELDLEKRVVPEFVRYLVATIDCQKYSFVVQVQGFGKENESCIIDRYSISVSTRKDEDGKPAVLEPASYTEDWDCLVDEVINKTYKTCTGQEMRTRITGCDMHGVPGLTQNAYAFWRKMRSEGLGERFRLLRGGNLKNTARVKESFPDQTAGGGVKGAKVKGDVPILTLNTDRLKDAISVYLDRLTPGPGYVHFPAWLPPDFYDELVAETRTDKGWVKDHDGVRNESLDLMVYALALLIFMGVEKIKWDNPPLWAEEWDKNSFIMQKEERKPTLPSFFSSSAGSGDPWLR